MKRVALTRLARIDLIDLQAASDSYGCDNMPHPFVHLQSSPFASYEDYATHTAAVAERLAHGDLGDLNSWFSSYLTADIRVECVVSTVGAPRGRLLAHRRGQRGFIAVQRPEEHVVEVYSVSPYELGQAIAETITLTQPGKHSKVEIPNFLRRTTRPPADQGETEIPVLHSDPDAGAVSLPKELVARCARVQSRWQPAREWGFDHTKKAVVAVTIEGDGDYIYTPDFEFLTPMTVLGLSNRIDELIAEDVQKVRQSQAG